MLKHYVIALGLGVAVQSYLMWDSVMLFVDMCPFSLFEFLASASGSAEFAEYATPGLRTIPGCALALLYFAIATRASRSTECTDGRPPDAG